MTTAGYNVRLPITGRRRAKWPGAERTEPADRKKDDAEDAEGGVA